MSDGDEKPDPIKFGDPELSDVTLAVANQDFLVHKMILSARSEYFKALFYGQFKKKASRTSDNGKFTDEGKVHSAADKLLDAYQDLQKVKMSPNNENPDPIKFGDPELSDVTLAVENQDCFVHKMVLSARSEYFKALFYGQFKEANMTRIEIKDVSVPAFRRLLELLYFGKVNDEDKFLTNKKETNYQCNMDDGSKQYHEIVCHLPDLVYSPKNFWNCTEELLEVADRYNLGDLAKDYIKQKLTDELCSRKMCCVCFDHWIFAEKHEIEVPHDKRNFAWEAYKSWNEKMEKDDQSSEPLIGVSMLFKILKKFKIV